MWESVHSVHRLRRGSLAGCEATAYYLGDEEKSILKFIGNVKYRDVRGRLEFTFHDMVSSKPGQSSLDMHRYIFCRKENSRSNNY